MTTHVLKPLAIALLLGIAPLSISTAYAVAAVAGPAGPAGATGATGATGLTGPAGANGTNGSNGAPGAQGLRGLAGTNGTNGSNGATGAQGLTGPSGGVKGDTGAPGAAGTPGAPGAAGAAGAPGLTGTVHAIGESYAGGIVFWIDASGEHGLIAAHADQSTEIQWYNGTHKSTGTNGDGVYAGAMNTMLIIAQETADTVGGTFAAKVAADYSVRDNGLDACTGAATEICYGDWYLPSKYELNLLYKQKVAVGVNGFGSGVYWSSTESSSGYAWDQFFSNGGQLPTVTSTAMLVRAIRAF